MIATTVLSTFLSFSPPNVSEPAVPWAPDRGEVSFTDDDLEILPFVAEGRLVGTLVLQLPQLPSEPSSHIQIDASFPEGFVSTPLLLLDEADIEAPEAAQLAPRLLTDLPLAEAHRRVRTMLAFVDEGDLGITAGYQELTKRQCATLFAVGGVVCATAALTGQVGIALACWSGSLSTVCTCAEYVPIKIC